MTKQRIIEVAGVKVDVVNFGYASFYYPQFNGNAEFKVSAKGFRQLSHYIRMVTYEYKRLEQILNLVD